MGKKNNPKLKEIMTALEKIQEVITGLKLEKERLLKEFKDELPGKRMMKIVN